MGALNILLVDDDQNLVTTLSYGLRKAMGDEVSVTICFSGSEALSMLTTQRFDVVISDIGLPDGTGHDLMKQIKERYRIPGVALTGYGMEDDLRRSSEMGFAEHVVKPVNIAHLQSVIRRVARSK